LGNWLFKENPIQLHCYLIYYWKLNEMLKILNWRTVSYIHIDCSGGISCNVKYLVLNCRILAHWILENICSLEHVWICQAACCHNPHETLYRNSDKVEPSCLLLHQADVKYRKAAVAGIQIHMPVDNILHLQAPCIINNKKHNLLSGA